MYGLALILAVAHGDPGGAATAEAVAPADDDPDDRDAQDDPDDPDDDSDDDAPEPIELALPEDVGGSALDDIEADAQPNDPDEPSFLPRFPLRGRISVRPILDATLLAADRTYWAMRVGLNVDHRYWFLADRAVQFAGHSRLQASFPFGTAFGRRFVLSSTAGPWIGPVGLAAGPVVRSDRVGWRSADVVLPDTLAVGGRGDVSLQLGRFSVSAGIELAWLTLGDRPPADPEAAVLPVLGDETAYRAGVGRQGDRWLVALRGTWRETAIGAEVDVGVSLGFRLL